MSLDDSLTSSDSLEERTRSASERGIPDELAALRRCKDIELYTGIDGEPVWTSARFSVNRSNYSQFFHYEGEFAPHEVLDYVLSATSNHKHLSQRKMVAAMAEVHGEVVAGYVRENAPSEKVVDYLLPEQGGTERETIEKTVEPDEPCESPAEDESSSDTRFMVPMKDVLEVGSFISQRVLNTTILSAGISHEQGPGGGIATVDVVELISYFANKGLYEEPTLRLADAYLG